MYDRVGAGRRPPDAAGAATDAYSLDAVGRYMGGGANPTPNPYRFGGAWGYITDTPGSGLLQLGARFYWPEIGRFIQQDPIGDGMNWYAYVGNNPLAWMDPEGLAYLRYYRQPGTNRGCLILYHDTGQAWGEWRALSGRLNGTGSIVEGRYRVDISQMQKRMFYNANPHAWLGIRGYGSVESWGPKRLTLDPTPRTRHAIEDAGRTGGFFLHGGDPAHGTTLGCIRLSNKDVDQLLGILGDIGTPVGLKAR